MGNCRVVVGANILHKFSLYLIKAHYLCIFE